MRRNLHIAVLSGDFLWGGGMEFLRHLINALLSIQNDYRLKLFLLLPVRNKVDTVADVGGIFLRTAGALRQGKFSLPRREPVFDASFRDYFRNIDGEIETVEYNEATGLIPALRRIGADVAMPAASPLGRSFPIPWVGYCYDFQHKYLPHYFNAQEYLSRDIHFATMLRDARAVIVNARSVKDDIDKFFPYRECEVFNLPFSAAPISNWLEDGSQDIRERYKLPSRYFLISNQFWIHKSHITALRALALLAKERDCADLSIVCTGKMEDYRFPDHVRDLKKEVRDLGIEDRTHFLGHIPKSDQIAIMKKSLAVLQPTLFEGGPGGGSVYDAIALGVPAILSDIPVNQEIEGEENLFYFKASSAPDLAHQIESFLEVEVRRPSKEELIARGNRRKQLMGEKLLAVAEYARNVHPAS